MIGKPLCNNCENYGHLFYNCKRPITSLGIICYRYNNDVVEYLMIQRKDTLGYVDFLRGKYNEYNDFHLKNIIQEMTDYEISQILNLSYDELWDKLWNKKNEPYDIKHKEKMLFVLKHKRYLLENPYWSLPEWGFPKGRRNYREKDIDCALREFREETGYPIFNLSFIHNIVPFEEVFTGSNLKSYKHKYYIGYMNYKDTLYNAKYQKSEIGNMKWCNYEECLSKIRHYNTEKKHVINCVNELIKNSNIY
jgi:8-oxo-dGTP pyrophosphatase MutT (NUDIX family)